MKNYPVHMTVIAALMTALVLGGVATDASASTSTPHYVLGSDITNGVRAANGATSWFADVSHVATYSVSNDAFDGSQSLELNTPNANDQVRILNSYGAGVTAPTVPEIISGASYSYTGANVNFQIEMFYTPVNSAYGPDPINGINKCTPAGSSYPGMCYTVIKWEPRLAPTAWNTVDLSSNDGLGSSTAGWVTTNRLGIYAKPGPIIGAPMSSYLAQMTNYQVLAVGVALGSGTANAVGFVKGITYGGQTYNFRAAPVLSAPDAPVNTSVVTSTINRDVTVSWAAPAHDGNSIITGYTVNIYNSSNVLVGSKNVAGTETSLLITGADYNADWNAEYTTSVFATNAVGNSTNSNLASFTTIPQPIIITAPSAPSGVNATTTGNTGVRVTWVAPNNNGGSPITSYTINVYDAGNNLVGTTTADGDATSAVMHGSQFDVSLSTNYHVTVTANNAIGSTANTITADSDFTTAPLPATPDQSILDSTNTGAVTVSVITHDLVAVIPESVASIGDTVYGTAYSTPLSLGAAIVAADHTATWKDVTQQLPVGEHRLAVTKTDSTLIGWAPFAVTQPVTDITNGNVTTASSPVLARTGFDITLTLEVMLFLFFFGTAGIILSRKIRNLEARNQA